MLPAAFGTLSNNFAGANITEVVGYAEITCQLLPWFVAAEPYSSGYTYHNILLIVSAVTTVLCLIFTVSLISVHLSNWVKPHEQKQIVRVILFPTIFAWFNFYSVWFYSKSWILLPFSELYECFALVAMFYLIVLFVSPDEATRGSHFAHLQRLHRYGNKRGTVKHEKGSLRWFQVLWVCVFQVLPVKLVTNLLEWILSATWCPLTYQLSKTSLAITVVESVSTSICIFSVITFAKRVSADLKGTKTRAKLISFKGIVGITLTQTPVFVGIASYGVFDRTKNVSVLDFTVGTPAFMKCCEMFVTSFIFLWSFTAVPYINLMPSMPRRRGVAGAFLEVLDIRDILKGYWYMMKIVFCCGVPAPNNNIKHGQDEGNFELIKSTITSDSQP